MAFMVRRRQSPDLRGLRPLEQFQTPPARRLRRRQSFDLRGLRHNVDDFDSATAVGTETEPRFEGIETTNPPFLDDFSQ